MQVGEVDKRATTRPSFTENVNEVRDVKARVEHINERLFNICSRLNVERIKHGMERSEVPNDECSMPEFISRLSNSINEEIGLAYDLLNEVEAAIG